MTRVTGPIAKLTRSLSTTAAAPRPSSNLITNASKTAAARVRKELESAADGRSSNDASESSRRMTTTTSHRPLPNPNRMNIPLMQTFHTSPRTAARLDTSAVDFAVLPSLDAASPEPQPALRVPLLPDNYSPDRTGFAPEVQDGPLPAPQISVVAASPDVVLPASALTEVEGMGVDGVELSFAHAPEPAKGQGPEGGMLRDLWKGLVEDVFGGESKAKHAL
ncbi:hypothetical protein NKR23_g852 [Pleurostoma richardsiae]|uniref:Uncharacterized protein n=1 Tax=Pleurostoma richardsiae TaxID=41990 RepID=A0AA38RTJ8_9PEZI|nr:hypothetical protein NKR23_g852 [Pleurostoma richardsiae]